MRSYVGFPHPFPLSQRERGNVEREMVFHHFAIG
jgi:hypothetical protein